MSLLETVQAGVDTAFSAIGDLKVSISFTTVTDRAYDFSTGTVDETPDGGSSVSLQGVLLQRTIASEGVSPHSPELVDILVKRVDLPADYHLFDEFTISNVVYTVASYKDDAYTVEFRGVGDG